LENEKAAQKRGRGLQAPPLCQASAVKLEGKTALRWEPQQ
jgi:hypothetical protein